MRIKTYVLYFGVEGYGNDYYILDSTKEFALEEARMCAENMCEQFEEDVKKAVYFVEVFDEKKHEDLI